MKHLSNTPLLATALVILAATIALAAQMMSVQVRSGQLRDKPGFLSKVVCELAYGDRVDLKSENRDWRQVSAKNGKTGWMHVSALTEQEIVLNPTNKDVETAASSDELALAGKGFNKQVEEQYKKQSKLNYAKVDEMEKIVVPQNYIQDFIRIGCLGKGGAK
ncbi:MULTISPECIES: SH3 domain-containing protein [unclassified Pseudodesulfovibrio]|uniref:SH3 domain-containing protein n=1 Tax=unclassified Pseudodesulfovibrio TaxID=2661612 RepID=UPI000FEBEC8A|nr:MULTISPECIES: SH3 domain-containing protein [unclassified Pseudodesulfovibrio]MCJ2163460.1 SH3 domain-containing protein [Pseudodesulfovibrio sp. S3-i]RWU06697.1 SH3 domain-containing protein [Pseudodesulfovibrio sp. S3]